jgi:hypothetical protein
MLALFERRTQQTQLVRTHNYRRGSLCESLRTYIPLSHHNSTRRVYDKLELARLV